MLYTTVSFYVRDAGSGQINDAQRTYGQDDGYGLLSQLRYLRCDAMHQQALTHNP
jgi:hypothetical protein